MALISGGGGSGGGAVSLLYDFTVTGSSKTSIDTNVDGAQAGLFSTAFTTLEIYHYLRTDEAATAVNVNCVLNNDATAKYDKQSLTGANTVASAAVQNAVNSWGLLCAGNSVDASVFGAGVLIIPNYSGTVGFKTATYMSGYQDSVAAHGRVDPYALTYVASPAITRIAIQPTTGGAKFLVGSRLTVYAR